MANWAGLGDPEEESDVGSPDKQNLAEESDHLTRAWREIDQDKLMIRNLIHPGTPRDSFERRITWGF